MSRLHLAVGLDTGSGVAPLLAAAAHLDGLVEILTLEDRFADPANDGPEATLVATFLAARTRRLGLLAGAPLPVLEPFHVSTAIATLDHVSEGRGGFLVQAPRGGRAVAARAAIGALNGFPEPQDDAFAQDAVDALEAVRLLWDSWDDDAVIRDASSQRFLDADRLHYIRFKTPAFDILGPSITPRPPQGQPVVAVRHAGGDDPRLALGADLVFLAGSIEEIAIAAARLRGSGRLLFADVPVSADRGVERDVAQARETAVRIGLSGLRFMPDATDRDVAPLAEHLATVTRAGAPAEGLLRQRLGLGPAVSRFGAARKAA